MHDPRVLLGFAAAVALSIATIASCGGRQQQPNNLSHAPSASSSLSFSPSSGSSPLDAEFVVGVCTLTMGGSPGSTYLFALAEQQKAIDALRSAIQPCFQRPSGVQGTVYLSAQVDAAGQVSDPVASPGGALATDAALCLGERLNKVKLPAPTSAPASLLVLVVSACSR